MKNFPTPEPDPPGLVFYTGLTTLPHLLPQVRVYGKACVELLLRWEIQLFNRNTALCLRTPR